MLSPIRDTSPSPKAVSPTNQPVVAKPAVGASQPDLASSGALPLRSQDNSSPQPEAPAQSGCDAAPAPSSPPAVPEAVTATDGPYSLVPDCTTLPVLSLRGREVGRLRLDNGLQIYLVSDPAASESGAALGVHAGSWQDDALGQAHLANRVLASGESELYPDEESFPKFIASHGGLRNAHTEGDHTSYYFSINHDFFPEALKRLASSLKAPSFNAMRVENEKRAVQQEFLSHADSDAWRLKHVEKALMNPEHPEHRFNVGNEETLNACTPDALRDWVATHYSANLMRLAATSNLPMQALQQLVVEAFADIPNRDLTPPRITVSSRASNTQQVAFMATKREVREVRLSFKLATDCDNIDNLKVLIGLLGHEGDTSLLAQLKREGLVESLSTWFTRDSSNENTLCIGMAVTEAGLLKRDTVLERCFQAIAGLRQHDVLPAHLFSETKSLLEIAYQYQERRNADTMYDDVERLLHTDLARYPEAAMVPSHFDPALMHRSLCNMLPERSEIFIIAPQRELGVELDRVTPWMDVRYAVQSIPDDKRAAWAAARPHPSISVPKPNPFVPERLTLENHTGSLSRPQLLVDTQGARIYLAQDDVYHTPNIDWTFSIKSPAIRFGDPRSMALTDLYVRCVRESLDEIAYDAALADLLFRVRRAGPNVQLCITGYSPTAEMLLQHVLHAMCMPQLSKMSFDTCKAASMRELKNQQRNAPTSQADTLAEQLIYEHITTPQQQLEAMAHITQDDVHRFAHDLREKNHVKGILAGNVSTHKAELICRRVLEALQKSAFPRNEHDVRRIIELPNDGPYLVRERRDVQSNAARLVIELGFSTHTRRAAANILTSALERRLDDALHTNQNASHETRNDLDTVKNHMFETFSLHSVTHTGEDLLDRLEAFLAAFVDDVNREVVSRQEFATIKSNLMTNLTKPDDTLEDAAIVLWSGAFNHKGDFANPEKRAKALDELTYEQWCIQVREWLGARNGRRLAVLVEGRINNAATFVPSDTFKYGNEAIERATQLRKNARYTDENGDV